MPKYRVRFNQDGRRKTVTGVFYARSKAERIARIINKRDSKANARISRVN